MKNDFELLRKALDDEGTWARLTDAKNVHSHYVGKKVLGFDFIVTDGGLIGAAFECGENALHAFFDGDDQTVKGKKVSAYMKDYADFPMAEKKTSKK